MQSYKYTDLSIIIVGFSLYSLNRFWLKKIVQIPYIAYLLRCHFNDFLAGILFFACYNFIHFQFLKTKYHLDTLWMVLALSLFCGVMWEYILPFLFKKSVSDFWDVIAYLFGGIIYHLIFQSFKKT